MLISLPDWVTPSDIDGALHSVAAKKPDLRTDAVQTLLLHEGLCLQTLHIGSYDDEGPILQQLHDELIPQRGLAYNGDHHEIYLSDPRRTAPERLRTVLRQPVSRS